MQPRCPVCGGGSRPAYPLRDLIWETPGTWSFGTCERCGHGMLLPAPAPAELAGLYASLWTDQNLALMERVGSGGFDRRLRRRRLRAIRAALGGLRVRRAVDVGCGLGHFASAMAAAFPGAEVLGVELSPRPAERAEAREGVRVLRSSFAEAPIRPDSAELLSMNHYLEHDPDPRAALERAALLLRPGGVIEVEIPRVEGWGRRLLRRWYWPHLAPQHLHLFSRAGLERLLRETGFEPVWGRAFGYPMLATAAVILWARFTFGSRSPHGRRWLVRGPGVLAGLAMLGPALAFDLLAAPLLALAGLGDILTVLARRR